MLLFNESVHHIEAGYSPGATKTLAVNDEKGSFRDYIGKVFYKRWQVLPVDSTSISIKKARAREDVGPSGNTSQRNSHASDTP